MDLGIAGRVAVVTAASKGLGFASALALREEGCRVAICARTQAGVDAAVEQLAGGDGDSVIGLVADMTDPQAPALVVSAAVEAFGRVDIVVGNSGGPPPGRAIDLDDDQIRAAIEANLLSNVRLVRAALPHMDGWGRLCFITSSSIKQPIGSLALSNTARTGFWAWAKTAATDLAERGITVNLVCPGSHATDRMIQLGYTQGRLGDPGDFGKIVAFLCSQPAAFVTGEAVLVDGGSTVGLH